MSQPVSLVTKMMISAALAAPGILAQEYCGVDVGALAEPLPTTAAELFATYGLVLEEPPAPAELTVQILQPLDGRNLFDETTPVLGTYSGPPNVGVTVNGTKADVHDGHFLVPAHTLTPGAENTIVVEAATLAGEVATAEVTVFQGTSTGPLPTALRPAVTINAVRDRPWVPSTGTFRLRTATDVQVTTVDWDFNGDGLVDLTTTGDEPAEHEFTEAGLQWVQATVHVQAGDPHVAQSQLLFTDIPTVRRRLCLLYSQLRRGLAAGDVVAALRPLTEPMREAYQPIFTELESELPAMGRQMGSVLTGQITDGFAELLVVRDQQGETLGFHVDFDCGADGIWRISHL